MRKEEEEKKERVTFMTIFTADHLSAVINPTGHGFKLEWCY